MKLYISRISFESNAIHISTSPTKTTKINIYIQVGNINTIQRQSNYNTVKITGLIKEQLKS